MFGAGVFLDRESSVPLHRQFAAALRGGILSGKLAPGERLLSSREYRAQLGLSRNTVVDALEQLHAEGFVITVRGVGTFVAEHVHALHHPRERSAVRVVATSWAQACMEAAPLAVQPGGAVPFRPGLPALDLFPTLAFKRCFRATDWTAAGIDYPDPRGYETLRESIAHRLYQTRGVSCTPEQVLITSGAQAAFALISAILVRPGDVTVVEDPGYANVRAILRTSGARIVPVPVDRDGIDPAVLPKRARLIHVTPSHQYPSGAILTLERRLALLERAARNGAWIVEDDYDAEFNYAGRAQPALHGLAGGGRVLYVGTMSKVLAPGLRIGYVVVPAELCRFFVAAHAVNGGPPDFMLQRALARFIDEGHLGRHVTRMRKVYDERRRFVCDKLGAAASGALQLSDTRAGLHLVADLRRDIEDVAFSRRALTAGVVVPPLSTYFARTPRRNGLVIGFAATALPAAGEAIATLTRLLGVRGRKAAPR
jgi:GntR family transcriptional regulator / MocR family aminotransferase